MRTSLFLAMLFALLGLAAQASAEELVASSQGLTDYSYGGCDTCGHGHRLHHKRCGGHLGHHKKNMDGLDRSFNCGCNGSYKFPVPPQYTYFWPGSVYSMQLMTNYHSPWRFPPLKPYTEEALVPVSDDDYGDGLRAVSATETLSGPQLRPGQIEPMSSMMERFFR